MKSVYSPEYRRLVHRLREARTEAGLKQDEVAKLFQFSSRGFAGVEVTVNPR